ncbi:MAG TPA: protein kinase [Terriglobales bacterium]|nr:protein kinase [Terriglobales bacterium]
MPLNAGTKLGPYEIQSPLGAGGMGEVYRALDTRLDRIVAIKVLPSHLSADPELKQRLEREAKAISALQHPNICTLYDIGTQDGTNFLVMEYLEGQTLAERLQKGPLPIDQILKIGAEIAAALAKAHQQGIIHRDLKPGNIMLTKAGAKLMDFGLAKPKLSIPSQAVGPFTPSTPTMNLASLTSAASPLTQKGSIVGTFQYMAPEILQGGEADARSDLFSFGCVLYEMTTGRHAFEGKSQLSVFTAILEKDPEPVSASQPLAPPLLDRVVRACLAKDSSDRIQSAHDVAMDLRWASESQAESAGAESSQTSPLFNKSTTPLIAAILLVFIAVAVFAGYRWARSTESAVSIHAEIPSPERFSLDATGDAGGMPVLSPQGDKIAFVAHSGETKLLFVRSLNSDGAQALDGTAGAAHPFWSPDGRYIGFFAGGQLMKIPAAGGPATAIAVAPNARGGSWGTSDMIVFAPNFEGPLAKVSAQGGLVTPASVIDPNKHSTHRWPWFLPDGKHFIFFAGNHFGGDPGQNGAYFGSVDNTQSHLLVATDSAAQYASGYLLYHAATALVAHPFDPESGTLSGTPVPVVNNLRDDVGVWRSIFAVSQNGFLIYQLGSTDSAKSHFVVFDRSGKALADYNPQEATITDARALLGVRDVRLSPDNQRVAFANGTGIWTFDFERKTRTRITFSEQPVQEPAWSPDGKSLLFLAQVGSGGGGAEIRSKAADGSGSEQKLLAELNNYHHPEWSRDGKYLTYLWGNGEKTVSLWIKPVNGDAKPVVIVQPPSPQSNIFNYRISPDSRWVAYQSDESGQVEIYITSFPDGKGKWRVSTNGGAYPAWGGSSKEIFYENLTADIFVCPLNAKEAELEVGTPQRLFHAASPGVGIPFDIFSDGKSLIVNHSEEEAQVPLQLVTNWPAELKK